MPYDFKVLNRFTTLPFLLDMLRRKKLTLLNPAFWEDFNDRETIEIYRKRVNAESIYALCLSYDDDNIHHWNAFASGTSGVCIRFSPNRLLGQLSLQGIKHDKAEYVRVRDLADFNYSLEKLPFVKREPFEAEKEYRLIVTSNQPQQGTYEVDIDINFIRQVTFSSKLPETVFEATKAMIREFFPDFQGKIYHSTLYKNERWIGFFRDGKNVR